MNVTLSEVGIVCNDDDTVELWKVRGLPTYYPTKIVAEMAARRYFPNEDEVDRYGRIGFVRFVREDTL